jgi:Ni,Fe-hydrogenase III large subunit
VIADGRENRGQDGSKEVVAVLHNGRAIDAHTVPRVPLLDFQRTIQDSIAARGRLASLFGIPRDEGRIELVALLADDEDGVLEAVRTVTDEPAYTSLTSTCPEAHMFEREIAERFGLAPIGHPWLKPVRFRRAWRGGGTPPTIGVTDFFRVEGESVHEVAVGPVHAGVIEPGHFRFQCHGEEVFHLEISLGYQHRGIEEAITRGHGKRTLHFMETLAGDTTIGHATAYVQIIEALSSARVPPRAIALRGIALELERLANHTGDLGALAGDVGFLPTQSFCGRLRGDFLNLTAALCGNRFGRSFVRPGGVHFDVDAAGAKRIRERLSAAAKDVEGAAALLFESPTVQARFEETGKLSAETARTLGLVGLAARASNLERDVRQDLPSGIYQFAQVPVSTYFTGDVFARAFVRWLEIQRSVKFIEELLDAIPAGPIHVDCPPLERGRFAASLVEGWRGEICHVAMTNDDAGTIGAYKIVDPSFHNWTGLAIALRGQQISDFPLCNKSFNLSYCGFDL